MSAPASSNLAPQEIATRYEELRRQVLAGVPGHGLGLALFLRGGMVAWLEAWSECTAVKPTAAATADAEASSLPVVPAWQSEVAQVLAGIALHNLQEVPK
jgi:hypothetical protein